MSRHALAQSRQDFAQAAMCLSSLYFSHSVAHLSQHFAQHSHASADSGLIRAVKVAASWMIAVSSLALFVSMMPHPGYVPDHME